MKIECVLHREGGTHVELGGIDYHFEPVADGAHVADVKEEAHIDRFLSIPESFKLYHGKAAPKGEPKAAAAKPASAPVNDAGTQTTAMLAGSEELPPQFEIGERVVTQLEAVQAAFAASGLTSDQWNELGDDERAAKIEIALDEMADAAEAGNDDTGEGEEVKTETPEAPKPAAKKAATTKKTSKK